MLTHASIAGLLRLQLVQLNTSAVEVEEQLYIITAQQLMDSNRAISLRHVTGATLCVAGLCCTVISSPAPPPPPPQSSVLYYALVAPPPRRCERLVSCSCVSMLEAVVEYLTTRTLGVKFREYLIRYISAFIGTDTRCGRRL